MRDLSREKPRASQPSVVIGRFVAEFALDRDCLKDAADGYTLAGSELLMWSDFPS